MLFILLILPKIIFLCLPIILAIYFTFSKKHKDEGVEDFEDGYKAWMD